MAGTSGLKAFRLGGSRFAQALHEHRVAMLRTFSQYREYPGDQGRTDL